MWMAENLKTTKDRNCNPIQNVTEKLPWTQTTSPAYCWYNNDEATNKNPYGALYNYYAVNTGTLCPIGWHVPTFEEWNTLITYAGDQLQQERNSELLMVRMSMASMLF